MKNLNNVRKVLGKKAGKVFAILLATAMIVTPIGFSVDAVDSEVAQENFTENAIDENGAGGYLFTDRYVG